MSMYDRAAQFSPYAALTGYGDMVKETARITESKRELGESEKAVIDQELSLISELIESGQHPQATVLYFEQDAYKAGGKYEEYSGTIKKVDAIAHELVFMAENGRLNGKHIPIGDIAEIYTEAQDLMDS